MTKFIGFIKGELTRRWAPKIGKEGSLWQRYLATALITAEAQVRCLKYVLSQSVKEAIVSRPQLWPGFHSAQALVTGEPDEGQWFNSTDYGKQLFKERKKRKPRPVDRGKYLEEYTIAYGQIPAWEDLSARAYRHEMKRLVDEIVAEGRSSRRARKQKLLGLDRLFRIRRTTKGCQPSVPWFENRRRMIVWDHLGSTEVKRFLDEYWDFQRAFREASARLMRGELEVEFPPGAFRPGLPQPKSAARPAAA